MLMQVRGMLPADDGAVARRDGPAPQPPQVLQERRARGIHVMSRTCLCPKCKCAAYANGSRDAYSSSHFYFETGLEKVRVPSSCACALLLDTSNQQRAGQVPSLGPLRVRGQPRQGLLRLPHPHRRAHVRPFGSHQVTPPPSAAHTRAVLACLHVFSWAGLSPFQCASSSLVLFLSSSLIVCLADAGVNLMPQKR